MQLLPRPSSKAISTVVDGPRTTRRCRSSWSSSRRPPRSSTRRCRASRAASSGWSAACSRLMLAGAGADPGRSGGDRAGPSSCPSRRRMVRAAAGDLDRALDRRARGRGVHAGQVLARLDPTFAAADHGRAGSPGGESSGPGVAHAGRGGRTGRSPIPGSTRTWRCRRRSTASARPSTITSWRTTRRRSTAWSPRSRKAKADVAGYRDRLAVATNVEQMRTRPGAAAGRQQAQHAGGDGQPRRDAAQPGQRAGDVANGAQRDLAALIAERDGYVQTWHADISREAVRRHQQAVRRARVAEQGAAAPPAGRIARRPGRHRADGRQGLGRIGAAVRPAVHHAGAGRRAAGGRGQYRRHATTASCMSAIRWRSSSIPSRITQYGMAHGTVRTHQRRQLHARRMSSAIRPARCRCRPTAREPVSTGRGSPSIASTCTTRRRVSASCRACR